MRRPAGRKQDVATMAHLLRFGAFLVWVEEHSGPALTCVQEPLFKLVKTRGERRGRRFTPVCICDDAFKIGRCSRLPRSGGTGVARAHGKRGEVALLVGVSIHITDFGDLQAQANMEEAVGQAVHGCTTG